MTRFRVLKARRALLGLTQHDISAASGLSQAFISRFERGLNDPLALSVDQYIKLAHAYRLGLVEFETVLGIAGLTVQALD